MKGAAVEMREIDSIILHCSDTTDGTFESIREFHIKERGWSDIGYHVLITRDGEIHKGRHLDTIGSHCKGENETSIGVCLIGKDTFTLNQVRSLIECVQFLLLRQGLTLDDVYCHHEFESAKAQGKTCPNFDINTFKGIIRKQILI